MDEPIDMSPAACVTRGALLLDEVRPDWFTLVDLDELDMTHGEWCVAGQVFDHWIRAKDMLHEYDPDAKYYASDAFMVRHGFDVSYSDEDEDATAVSYAGRLNALEPLWRFEIGARVAAASTVQ